MKYQIPILPLKEDIETKKVLKKVALAHSALAEMKGAAASIPNEKILLNTLALQEAKDSSEIENIITTQDELYQSDFIAQKFKSPAAKEVYNYSQALLTGFTNLQSKGILSTNQILEIQSILVENKAGFRKLPGTMLKNDRTGEVIYTPPQNLDDIVQYMNNLELFINDDSVSDLDVLAKMAIIHHQFESIHPFYDGNGRTGRIINILYLVKEELLNIPILYLSRYINQNKNTYYELLQKVRDKSAWEEWILFMLEGVESTSRQTTYTIHGIKDLMLSQKQKIRSELPKIYSQDLLNNIFGHPYTKIEFVMKDLSVSRVTATRYLDELTKIGILHKEKIWKEYYYVNKDLFTFLSNIPTLM
ncbi:MAG: Fic family protein [Bacteroidales bacterium]|jgi:Fic family protein|nr:Fic family protein [Bacteroidales bacterium]